MQNNNSTTSGKADPLANDSVAGNKSSLFIAKDRNQAFVDRAGAGKAPAKVGAFFGGKEQAVEVNVDIKAQPKTVESASEFTRRRMSEMQQLEKATSRVSEKFTDREMAFFGKQQTEVCEHVLTQAKAILLAASAGLSNDGKGFHP